MNNSLITTGASRPAEITGEVADTCKTRKNAYLASALFQCSLIRFDAADAAAADHKATPPPPPMKNARRAAAASHKTTQRRRQQPVRRRTALVPRRIGTVAGRVDPQGFAEMTPPSLAFPDPVLLAVL